MVFDSRFRSLQKDRTILQPNPRDFDYLRDEVACRLVDRVADIKKPFSSIVDLGAHTGSIARALLASKEQKLVSLVDKLIQVESCEGMLRLAPETKRKIPSSLLHQLPPASTELIVSSMAMHWVEDLPLFLQGIRTALKPGGVFIGAMLGGDSLNEMRSAFALADQERCGGLSPHVSPFTRSRDLGSLLQQAGFELPTVDSDKIICPYPDMFTLMGHLQGMGEANSLEHRRLHVPRDVFVAASAIFDELYREPESSITTPGLIPCTFQVLYVIGWAPDDDIRTTHHPPEEDELSQQGSLK